MPQTIKQMIRQPFGYLIEDLLREYFHFHDTFCISKTRHFINEMLDIKNTHALNLLLEFYDLIIKIDDDKFKDALGLNLPEQIEKLINKRYGAEYDSESWKKFNKDHSIDKRDYIKLRKISEFIERNKIELLRIEQNEVIVSEVKSQFGPRPDYKIELESDQLDIFTKLTNEGINASLLYCIAFPKPRFVEIPFKQLYKKFEKFIDWNGKEFTDRGRVRIRIPLEYRNIDMFREIDKNLYHFHDVNSIIKEILDRHPGEFKRLGELVCT
jgi:hypothetical protein